MWYKYLFTNFYFHCLLIRSNVVTLQFSFCKLKIWEQKNCTKWLHACFKRKIKYICFILHIFFPLNRKEKKSNDYFSPRFDKRTYNKIMYILFILFIKLYIILIILFISSLFEEVGFHEWVWRIGVLAAR